MRTVQLTALIIAVGCKSTEPAPEPLAQPTESQNEPRPGSESASVKRVNAASLDNLHPFRNISDAQLGAELDAAYALAKSEEKHVLLDFVASWCHDCVEVLKVAGKPPASDVISERYVYIPVNVGDFDRAEALRKKFKIKRIATLVVLDAGGNRIAQSTLEPLSKKKVLTPEALAEWLRAPTDEISALDKRPSDSKSEKDG